MSDLPCSSHHIVGHLQVCRYTVSHSMHNVTRFGKMCIAHTYNFEYLDIYKSHSELYRVETIRATRGTVILQSLKVSNPFNIPNRFYEAPKLKNWMCELCSFSHILSSLAHWYDVLFINNRIPLLKEVHNFVHLNLIIALFFALLIFVIGIELAAGNEVKENFVVHVGHNIIIQKQVTCTMVATILHYFFTSVFTWMLCEGLMMYFLLVKVFNNGIGQRKLFYSSLGWGKSP